MENVETYDICEENHATSSFPPFHKLKEVYQEENEGTDQTLFIV
jgi:hypothetical protein